MALPLLGWKTGWPNRACALPCQTPLRRRRRRMQHLSSPPPRRQPPTRQARQAARGAMCPCCSVASSPHPPHARASCKACRCRAPRKPLATPTRLPRYHVLITPQHLDTLHITGQRSHRKLPRAMCPARTKLKACCACCARHCHCTQAHADRNPWRRTTNKAPGGCCTQCRPRHGLPPAQGTRQDRSHQSCGSQTNCESTHRGGGGQGASRR